MTIFDVHSHWGTKRGYPLQTEEELAQRREKWGLPDQSELSGWLARYAKMATSANKGAVLEV